MSSKWLELQDWEMRHGTKAVLVIGVEDVQAYLKDRKKFASAVEIEDALLKDDVNLSVVEQLETAAIQQIVSRMKTYDL